MAKIIGHVAGKQAMDGALHKKWTSQHEVLTSLQEITNWCGKRSDVSLPRDKARELKGHNYLQASYQPDLFCQAKISYLDNAFYADEDV